MNYSEKAGPAATDALKVSRVWIPLLLCLCLSANGGLDNCPLNISRVYMVKNILRFNPEAGAPVLKPVSDLPKSILAAIVHDSIGIECLLSPILQTCHGGNSHIAPAVEASQMVLGTCQGCMVDQACDGVAGKFLFECFYLSNLRTKRLDPLWECIIYLLAWLGIGNGGEGMLWCWANFAINRHSLVCSAATLLQ